MGMIAVGDWKYIPARAIDEWVVGVDLGKSADNTAIGVIHHTVKWRRRGHR